MFIQVRKNAIYELIYNTQEVVLVAMTDLLPVLVFNAKHI